MTPRQTLLVILWMVGSFMVYISFFLHPLIRDALWKWMAFMAVFLAPMLYFAWKNIGPSEDKK